MTRKNPIYLTVLLVALAIVVTFQTTFIFCGGFDRDDVGETGGDTTESSDAPIDDATLAKLKELAAIYSAYFPDDMDAEEIEKYLMYSFIAGAGDTFGNYVGADELEDHLSSIDGNYKGIGVSVIYNQQYDAIEILAVFPDTPAEEAGIAPGDILLYVGAGEEKKSVSELGYYKALDLVKGEEGTTASFTILRGTELIDFTVPRREVTSQTVQFHMYSLDSRVAVIRITQFEKATVEQFKVALSQAQAAGAEAYVFDVRSNPGGELGTITSILDMLLPEGPIIRIEYKDERYNYSISSDSSYLDAPMAVLCNGSTASAGELFCSALKDYKVATLVGKQTFGKGTMQTLVRLSDGSAVSMTVAYYLPPFSENYHGVGVAPDIECDISDELINVNINKYTDENDNQLKAAVEALGLGQNN